jgi:hypothetical protein
MKTDDQLLAELSDALRSPAVAPTDDEVEQLRRAVEDRRDGVQPADVVAMPSRRRAPRARLLVAAAVALVFVAAIGALVASRVLPDETRIASDPVDAPSDTAAFRAATRALDDLRDALRLDDPAAIATALETFDPRFAALAPEDRLRLEPEATNVRTRAERRLTAVGPDTTATTTTPGPSATVDDDDDPDDNSGPGSGDDNSGSGRDDSGADDSGGSSGPG